MSSIQKATPDDVAQLPNFNSKLVAGANLSGYEDESTRRLMQAKYLLEKTMVSFKPLLPLVLSLKGRPFTLDRLEGADARYSPGYAPFEPFYRTRIARKSIFKTGRQVAKSSSLAARGIIHSATHPHFTTLYITPLFEMVRRFSQNYVGPFLETSPIKAALMGKNSTGSVLQRTFRNFSKMIFSFAYLSAERTRGVSAMKNSYDEVQDLDKDFIPIIRETMSGSPYGTIEEFAGTPLGLENTLEMLWMDSSQGEWCIKCHRCGYWNVPSLANDLDEMIGPMHDAISYQKPAVICAKCRRFIYPQTGCWVHGRPEKRWEAMGLHIPQFILPMHFADPQKWGQLLGKREGRGNTPANVFYNEVCGESYDTGSRIITISELKAAATLPWSCQLTEAKNACGLDDYVIRILGCDWGGGGEDMMSYTCYSVVGMRGDGKLEVIFGYRSLTPHDHLREARLALGFASQFKCHYIAHDYTGAGATRETFITQSGYPTERVINVAYVRAAASARVMTFKPPTRQNPRPYWQVDKTRSLQLICNQIKTLWLMFFRFDFVNSDDTGLIYDFLALVDEKTDSRIGKDVYTIIRDPNMRDDFAQATNIACCSIWNATDRWPDLASVAHLRVDQALLDAIHPTDQNVLQDMV